MYFITNGYKRFLFFIDQLVRSKATCSFKQLCALNYYSQEPNGEKIRKELVSVLDVGGKPQRVYSRKKNMLQSCRDWKPTPGIVPPAWFEPGDLEVEDEERTLYKNLIRTLYLCYTQTTKVLTFHKLWQSSAKQAKLPLKRNKLHANIVHSLADLSDMYNLWPITILHYAIADWMMAWAPNCLIWPVYANNQPNQPS